MPAGTGQQPRGCIIPQAATHSLVLLEDGQNNCPKHVELTGIINKLLLLHLAGCLYYLYFTHFIQATGRPHRGCIILQTVNTV